MCMTVGGGCFMLFEYTWLHDSEGDGDGDNSDD